MKLEMVSLRRLRNADEDYKLLEKWYQQEEIYLHFEQRKLTLDEIKAKYYSRTLENSNVPVYMIEYDGRPIGIIQYKMIGDNNKKIYELEDDNSYEIDIFIGELEYHGMGIGQKSVKIISDYLFNDKSANLLVMCPLKENTTAINCYQKCGFKIKDEFTTKNTIGVLQEYVLMVKEDVVDNYYKAYDDRYHQVYLNNMLWSSMRPTEEVVDFLKKYNCQKDDLVLDLGCGEGRDAIFLLDKGYNVLAIDYSNNAIAKCNALTNGRYTNFFMQFDIIKDNLNKKFKYIYSVAVLHMFVTDVHRKTFLKFLREHLTDDGVALICVLGDGIKEHSSDITKSFENTRRVVMNNNVSLDVATTSCRVVNWQTLEREVADSNLKIKEKWISKKIPEFASSMCVVISK